MNNKPTDQQIIDAAKSAISMTAAAALLRIHFNTFKSRAVKLGVYKTNQGGKGYSKPSSTQISLDDILEGNHPQYQTFKLKHRLFEAGVKKNECEQCGLSEWRGSHIACELDHINGNSRDHRLENLRILCPNCHSQTETFRAKNIRRLESLSELA